VTQATSVFPWLDPDVSATRALVMDTLTLDGAKLDTDVATAIQDIPFIRTITGASSVKLMLIDPHGDLLDSGLFNAAVDVELPAPNGRILGYRMVAFTYSAPVLTVEFEDVEVSRLRGHKRPRQASRSDVTRAEFIRMLVREAPGIRFWSPELHKRQPIGSTRNQVPKAAKHARRDPGFGSYVPKVKGKAATRQQIRILENVLDTTISHNGDRRAQIGAVEAVTQESVVQNDRGNPVGSVQVPISGGTVGGHMENVGVLHQDSRYWPASRDISRDVAAFVDKLVPVLKAQSQQTIGWCVDQVQRSFTVNTGAQGSLYDQWREEASATVDAYTGRESQAGQFEETTYRKRYVFRRGEPGGKREDTWTCSGRLAEEVQWRRFLDLGMFVYASDDFLRKQAPRQTIKRGDLPPGVLEVRVPKWDVGQDMAEVEIDVMLDVLEPPLGAVWVLDGYGRADGRYLLEEVSGSYLRPKATVTLTSPRPKLPEPAPETGTRERATAQSGTFDKVAGSQLVYPIAIHGTDLGGVAAHKARPFGNWQSDNAVDIGCPIGTEVFAVDDGVIVRLGGAYDGTGQSNPNGFNVTLKTSTNQWFYTHLSQRRALQIGQRVDRGMSFGRTGAANGVAHLHIGSEKGDPEALLRVNKPDSLAAQRQRQIDHNI
jgi:murein DD-endopeptidase MepM/ murein hydrolase activator NlpD